MPDANGSNRLNRMERILAQTNRAITRNNRTITEIVAIQKRQAKKMAGFDRRQDRAQRHLEVLISVVDGLIRDRRFKDLEKRVSDLEEKGGQP